MNEKIAYWAGLSGHLGLLMWIMAGLASGWVELPGFLPKAIALAVLLFPLLAPLRGLLHGRPYTFAWATFMALAYFVISVWTAAVADDRAFGVGMALFSLLFFIGCTAYARLAGRRLKQEASSSSSD